jgi:hypothetical protein
VYTTENWVPKRKSWLKVQMSSRRCWLMRRFRNSVLVLPLPSTGLARIAAAVLVLASGRPAAAACSNPFAPNLAHNLHHKEG